MPKKSAFLKNFQLEKIHRLCLAEVWIAIPGGKAGDALAATLGHRAGNLGKPGAAADAPAPSRYQRVLIAELDWQKTFATLDTFQCLGQKARIATVTRYECSGSRLGPMVEAINLGLQLPRLYAVNAVVSRGAMEVALRLNRTSGKIKEDRSAALLTSQREAQGIIAERLDRGFHNGDLDQGQLPKARHRFDYDLFLKLWQQARADYGLVQAVAWLSAGRGVGRPVMFQPIPCDSTVVDRRQWIAEGLAAREAGKLLRELKKSPLPDGDAAYHALQLEKAACQDRASRTGAAETAFHNLPIIDEAELGRRAYGRDMPAGFRLDAEALALLAGHRRDVAAPPASLKPGVMFDRYAPVKDQTLFIPANFRTHGGYCSFSPNRLVAEENLGVPLPVGLERPLQSEWQYAPALLRDRSLGITQQPRNSIGRKQRVNTSRKAAVKKRGTAALPQRLLPLEPLIDKPQHDPFTTTIPDAQTDLFAADHPADRHFPVRPNDRPGRYKPFIGDAPGPEPV